MKRKQPLKTKKLGKERITRAEFNKLHAADPDAIKLVKQFAKEFKLKVEADPKQAARRTVQLTGTVADVQKAFGVQLAQTVIDGQKYRVREGSITLPAGLIGSVTAVLGLDNRPQAVPHFRVRKALAAATPEAGGFEPHAGSPGVTYTPIQVAQAYGFAGASGAGQTIGIIELGGSYRTARYYRLLQKPRASSPQRYSGLGRRRHEHALQGKRRRRRSDAGHRSSCGGSSGSEDRRLLHAEHGPGIYRRDHDGGA